MNRGDARWARMKAAFDHTAATMPRYCTCIVHQGTIVVPDPHCPRHEDVTP